MRESQEHGQEHACDADSYQSSDEDSRRYGEPITYESSHRSKDQNGNNGYGEAYARISSRLTWIRLKRGYQLRNTKPPEISFRALLSDGAPEEVRFERVMDG